MYQSQVAQNLCRHTARQRERCEPSSTKQASNAQGFDAWLEADLGDKQIQVEAKPVDIQWFQSNLDEACLSEAIGDFDTSVGFTDLAHTTNHHGTGHDLPCSTLISTRLTYAAWNLRWQYTRIQ